MTDESKSVPMLHEASTSEDVRSLLTFARAQGPRQDDLDRLSKRLSPLIGLSVADLACPLSELGTAPANPPSFSASIAAGKGTLFKFGLSSLSKALVAVSIVSAGAVWWALPSPNREQPERGLTPVTGPRLESKIDPQVVEPPRAPALTSSPVLEPAQAVPAPEPTAPVRSVHARVDDAKPSSTAARPLENPSEMELIRRAEERRAQPAQALRSLNEHARLYPNGMLAQEREVLAIEALLLAGQRTAAEARASQLATSHPGSAHLRRVRVLLGAGSPE